MNLLVHLIFFDASRRIHFRDTHTCVLFLFYNTRTHLRLEYCMHRISYYFPHFSILRPCMNRLFGVYGLCHILPQFIVAAGTAQISRLRISFWATLELHMIYDKIGMSCLKYCAVHQEGYFHAWKNAHSTIQSFLLEGTLTTNHTRVLTKNDAFTKGKTFR